MRAEVARWDRALVTGASSGIGQAIAARLAADGVGVVLVARRADRLAALAGRLAREHGVPTEVLVADLADPDRRHDVETRLADRTEPVDLLVNCAGSGLAGPLIAQSVDQRGREVELNAASVLRLCHVAAATMVARGHGTILNVASGLGFYPCPGAATYSAGKAFTLNLSATLRYELRGTGVTMTVVSPGPTATDAARLAGADLSRVPRFLLADPARVADAALDAARAGRAVEHVTRWNALLAFGGHLPPRLTQPIMARLFRLVVPQNRP